ncbi:MAG: hypothetical protein R3E95_02435 [Thiolinea sp.]
MTQTQNEERRTVGGAAFGVISDETNDNHHTRTRKGGAVNSDFNLHLDGFTPASRWLDAFHAGDRPAAFANLTRLFWLTFRGRWQRRAKK